MLLLAVHIDGNASSRVNLHRFLWRGNSRRQILDRRRVVDFLGQELLSGIVDASLLQSAQDFLLLLGIDASIRCCGGDHGTDVEDSLFVRHGIGLKAGAARRRNQSLLGRRLGAGERRQALLVVLIGLVGETADQREPAEV